MSDGRDVSVRGLPDDVPGSRVEPVLVALAGATERLLANVRHRTDLLGEPSMLPGWSRTAVLAHLRYVTEALRHMTNTALTDGVSDMYPGGRARVRPATLHLRPGEEVEELIESLASATAALLARWQDLAVGDWDLRVAAVDQGAMRVSRFPVMLLTEIEVHSVDLGLPGLDRWSDEFVETLLPLRLAWLGAARRRPEADLEVDGSWSFTDNRLAWLVRADGVEVVVGETSPAHSADCRFTGTPHDLLAVLLGRPATVERAGSRELGRGFKAAFPGP